MHHGYISTWVVGLVLEVASKLEQWVAFQQSKVVQGGFMLS